MHGLDVASMVVILLALGVPGCMSAWEDVNEEVVEAPQTCGECMTDSECEALCPQEE